MASDPQKGSLFEGNVAQLLRLMGYHVVTNERLGGTQIDLVAHRNDALDNICLLVECGDRAEPVGIEMIKQKASVLLSLQDPRYLFRMLYVSRNGFTADAKTFARNQSSLKLMTFDELEGQLVNFSPYVDAYCHAYERSDGMFREGKLFGQFVEPAVRDEKGKLWPSLSRVAHKWLDDDKNNLLFLLGEYGSGKSSFCRNLTYQLLKERATKGMRSNLHLPILFNLRELRNGFKIQQLVTDTLINQYGVSLTSFHAFERACSTGRILLVLDGFDEMVGSSDERVIIDCFSQLFILASLNAKTMLTCRSNIFSSHKDLLQLIRRFSIDIPSIESTESIRIAFDRHGRVLTLQPWDGTRIRQFIKSNCGQDAESVINSISQIHDLSDLSSRPVLLDMIVKTMPELQKSRSPVHSAALYELYTTKWTSRDDWRVVTPPTVRQTFCETLATIMHRARMSSISYDSLDRAIVLALSGFAKNDENLDELKSDIQTCSFLVRSSDGFRFAHKSFVEFFIARHVVDTLIGRGTSHPTKADVDSFTGEGRSQQIWTIADALDVLPGSLVSIGATSKFEAIRLVLARRTATPKGAMLFGRWGSSWSGSDSAEEVITATLEQHAKSIFDDFGPSDQDEIDSSEIATFAIEYIAHLDIPIDRCMAVADTDDKAARLASILRKAQPTDYVRANAAAIKRYVLSGEAKSGRRQEIVAASLGAALAKVPEAMTAEFVLAARGVLSPPAWQYLLFEIVSSGHSDQQIFQSVLKLDNLHLLEKIIAVLGTRELVGSSAVEVTLLSLAKELAATADDTEQSMIIDVLSLLNFSDEYLIELYRSLQTNDSSAKVRLIAADLLAGLDSERAWRGVRSLWTHESDPRLRKRLQTAEEAIRSRTSEKKNRHAFKHGGRQQAIRDRMWAGLRG